VQQAPDGFGDQSGGGLAGAGEHRVVGTIVRMTADAYWVAGVI
jgi:hypothetical protein